MATSPSSDSSSDGIPWRDWIRNTLLVVVALVMVWLVFNVDLPDLDTIQSTITGYGWAGMAIFIAAYAVVALTPIPVTIMAVAGGLIYGGVLGSILSVIGVTIGCYGAYWLARALGRETVTKLLGDRASSVEANLDNAGFEAVFMLRLLPGFPYWPVNYGAGAFGVTQRDFMIASVLASIPGQTSLASIGGFIGSPDWLHVALIAVSWVVVIALTIWAFRRWRAARKPVTESDE